MSQKGFVGIIVLIALLVVGVGAGAYYFGKVSNKAEIQQTNNSSPTSSPSQNAEALSNSPEAVTLIEKLVQLKKSTVVSGDETINLTFQIPSNWTLQTVAKASNPSDLIKNCSDFVITSPSSTKLVISPICGGWSANYSPIPQNQTTVTGDTIRYFSSGNQYKYADVDKTSNQMMDAILIKYSNKFIPTHISLTSSVNSDIQTSDQIVSSLKASVQ